jgi:hypothetical protein
MTAQSIGQTPKPLFVDNASLLAFVASAMRDPCAAAAALAAKLDARCTHHEGSLLAAVLDDWAYAQVDDDFDALAWHCTREDLADDVRLAIVAVVVGARAAQKTLTGTKSGPTRAGQSVAAPFRRPTGAATDTLSDMPRRSPQAEGLRGEPPVRASRASRGRSQPQGVDESYRAPSTTWASYWRRFSVHHQSGP